jgi:hypothetical protein
MRRTVFILLIIVLVGSIAFFFSKFFDENDIDIIPKDSSNLIVVASPIKDSEISSPLSVAGRARGYWFFEGSFPVDLLDEYGNIIASSHATAQGKWTTTDFVKFVGNLEFSNYIKGSKGTLVLKKDNPSGDPEKNDSVSIPIIFK